MFGPQKSPPASPAMGASVMEGAPTWGVLSQWASRSQFVEMEFFELCETFGV